VLDSDRELSQESRKHAGGPPPHGTSMDWKQVFLEHLDTIDRAAAHACRRYGLGREDLEDFTQYVKVKICSDDYAVLRKHRGLSKLSTYLVVVVQKASQDFVNSKWGKWRPSAEARRLGAAATRLERLLIRDQRSFHEACQVLRTNDHEQISESELSDLAAKLPWRRPRRPEVSLETGGPSGSASGGLDPRQVAGAESADERVLECEAARQRQRIRAAFAAALGALPEEDREIVLLRGELKVVEIALRKGLEEKPLYKRLEKILLRLRRAMEGAGISARDISEMLDHADD
jgi:RNA polymerase sigma factor (sigma-70 family)